MPSSGKTAHDLALQYVEDGKNRRVKNADGSISGDNSYASPKDFNKVIQLLSAASSKSVDHSFRAPIF